MKKQLTKQQKSEHKKFRKQRKNSRGKAYQIL